MGRSVNVFTVKENMDKKFEIASMVSNEQGIEDVDLIGDKMKIVCYPDDMDQELIGWIRPFLNENGYRYRKTEALCKGIYIDTYERINN